MLLVQIFLLRRMAHKQIENPHYVNVPLLHTLTAASINKIFLYGGQRKE